MTPMSDLLIVDDDANMRSTLAEILIDDGIDVHTASCGEEAVALCRARQFRLVLMDVRMPGIDGIEAGRRIREHSKRARIVIMSAHAELEIERRVLRAGGFPFLRKPLEVETVLKMIAEVTSTLIAYVGPRASAERQLHQALVEGRLRSTVAATVDEAIAMIDQIHYDALILDLDAIGDAESVIDTLRAAHPRCPILALGTSVAERPAGAYASVAKPLGHEQLIALLDQIKLEQRMMSAD